MLFGKNTFVASALALVSAALLPAQASAEAFENAFDQAFGTQLRQPTSFNTVYSSDLEAQIGMLAEGSQGRIGVAALDLETGETVSVLGDQRFPMASTSKIAIAATFLEGVDKGRWSMDDEFPLMIPVRSKKFSSKVAPVREGQKLPASELMELMLTRSSNSATDAFLAVVGGPKAVNDWVDRAGIDGFHLDRDIATLVRDDGEIDPVQRIDMRDSATPIAMVSLLKGLYEGRWLSESSRNILIGTMERCRTGVRRIPALMPDNVLVAHKTGSLHNTSSDVGILTAPNGHSVIVAIYVTGQGQKLKRESRIASIARAVYDGFSDKRENLWVNANYGAGGGE